MKKLKMDKGTALTFEGAATNILRTVGREIFMNEGYIPNFKMHEIKADEIQIGTYNVAELELLLKKTDIKKCSFAEYQC